MPFYINRNFENQLYEYLSSIQAWVNSRPIDLGGVSGPDGGTGSPWRFIGQLAQSRVAFDTTESSNYTLPTSGWSLVHNLNRIRHRITDLESVLSGVGIYGTIIQEDDITVASGITIINFEGPVTVTKDSSSKVTVAVTVSGYSAGDSVISETLFSQLPASGTSTLYSRTDHTHGTPYQPTREIIFTFPNELTQSLGALRMYNQLGVNFHINKVLIAVYSPPVTSGIVLVDIHKNGFSIFSDDSHKPTITSGNYTGYTTTIDSPDFNDGDYLTMDLDMVGSGTSFLTATIKLVDTNL